MIKSKFAVLSMDIEDWYHLDYFSGKIKDKSISMLDGLDNYLELLDKNDVKTTFFALSELSEIARSSILRANEYGHEIACHGLTHKRPILMETKIFRDEVVKAKKTLEDLTGKEILGYRAPCYSIDRKKLDEIKDIGFKYDSSKIAFDDHPLYGSLKLNDFNLVREGIFEKNGFYEFELSTSKLLGKNIPVSGGGYIRILPWLFMRKMISDYLKNAEIYVLYIHPFELSAKKMPFVPGTSALTNIRARKGLGHVNERIQRLIEMLKINGFEIRTFSDIVSILEHEKQEKTHEKN